MSVKSSVFGRNRWTTGLRTLGCLAALGLVVGGCSDEGPGVPTDVQVTQDTAPPLDTVVSDDVNTPDGETADAPGEAVTLGIVSVSPGRGQSIGLEQVEVVGTGFRSGQQVFFGESLAQDIFVLNAQRIVLLTPPRPAGLVDVRVADPDTGAVAVLEKGFLYYNLIAVTAVTPARGSILGGERVTINGNGFRPESVVFFDGQAALEVDVVSDDTITALTPARRTAGPATVHVANELGFGSLAEAYHYVSAPKLDLVVPPVGPTAGGTTIELRGSGFEAPLTVRIGESLLTGMEIISSTRIRGVTPSVTSEGARDVVVTTSEGTSALNGGFTYLGNLDPTAPLALLGVAPSSGRRSGREQVSLIARGVGELATTSVSFGGRGATVRAVDAAQFLVVVETPSGTGTVDVSLTSNGQTSTLSRAFRFIAGVSVDSVSPASGPVTGGGNITVRGSGFEAGLDLRIGALSASAVRVIDGNTIEAVIPPGAPGLVDVVVVQQGVIYRLNDAYMYEGDYDFHLVDPSAGSQAGGTLVSLIGSGFPSDARVRFGNRFATHVAVKSNNLITCKTPPGDLGIVSVTIVSASLGNLTINDAFTYYDPTTNFGGTWGGPIEGEVNVTVIDSQTNQPIADAFVMLWTDPRTPYQGFTDTRGQITFSGEDLSGEQMVSASRAGYSRASVVEYDAKNVTVYLNPESPPSSGEPPPEPEPADYTGVVRNLGKSVPLPMGRCANTFGSGTQCKACVDDSTCGANSRCSTIPNQNADGSSGKFCTKSCTAPAQCGNNFSCLPLNGVADLQCLPVAGVVTAFCDVTNDVPDPFSRDFIPDPGIQVNADMTFVLPVPFGEFAVFCWGGVLKNGEFTRLSLGVDRHVFANPGDHLTGEVSMKHPLNKSYTFALDTVPRGPDGPDIDAMWANIQLSEGYIAFDPVVGRRVTSFTLPNFLGQFTGDIAGSSFTFLAASLSDWTESQTLTFHQNIPYLDNDVIFYGRDAEWEARRSGITQNLNGVWRAGEGTVAVGSEGLIVRKVGNAWARQSAGVSRTLRAVHGVGTGAAGELVAVGDGGTIVRWNGLTWAAEASGATQDLLGVWMADAATGFAVGNNVVLRYAAGAWAPVTGIPSRRMNGVWGFAANDVWAVGNGGAVFRYDGATWTSQPTGTSLAARSVWGTSSNDLWIVGEGGLVLHYNGLEFQRFQLGTTRTFTKVWGTAADRVYVVGARGEAYVWDGSSFARLPLGPTAQEIDLLAIGGTEADLVVTGRNELVLGPIIPIPEQMRPSQGQVMTNDYRLSWRSQPGTLPHFHFIQIAIPTMMGDVPEWDIVADYDVDNILLPDFPSIEGTPGITPGAKVLTVQRVYKEGFNIDSHSNADFSIWGWRSWSQQTIEFTKL